MAGTNNAPLAPENMNFPNDENGDILRKMSQRGDDLSKSREINFYFAFPEQLQAQNFAKQVRITMDLEAEVARYEERDMWEATVTKKLFPRIKRSRNWKAHLIESRRFTTEKRMDGDA